MLTAEGGDRSVTRNSSHFKKLLQDHADPVSVDINSSAVPVSVDTSSSASAQAELPLRINNGNSQTPPLPIFPEGGVMSVHRLLFRGYEF